MVYTVEYKEQCDADLAERIALGGRLYKLGMGQMKEVMYRGGAVWPTRAAAQAWVDERGTKPDSSSERAAVPLAVYGVEAVWGKETMDYGEGFQRLLMTRPLVVLCPRRGNFGMCELEVGHSGLHANQYEGFVQIDVDEVGTTTSTVETNS